MSITYEFNTVEDLVTHATTHIHDTTKWMLEDRGQWEFVDAEAGKAWHEQEPKWVSRSASEDEQQAYQAAMKVWRAAEPKQVNVVHWSLSDRSPYGGYYARLSAKLGELLNTIWKTGPSYRGSLYTKRVGMLTIAGMLKRLGMKGLDKQIADARVAEEIQQKKNHRNYERRNVRELAAKIVETIAKYPEIQFPTSVYDLASPETNKDEA